MPADQLAVAVLLPHKHSLTALWRDAAPLFALLARSVERAVVLSRPAAEQVVKADHVWRGLLDLARGAVQFEIVPGMFSAAADTPPLPELAPQPPANPWFPTYLESISDAELFPKPANRTAAIAARAGLLQINDCLGASHELSQSIQGTQAGDYWHGIMHRREPDYSNSQYWFGRVGGHPIFEALVKFVQAPLRDNIESRWSHQLTWRGWDSSAFVDFCQQAKLSREPRMIAAAEQIQFCEMLELLRNNYRSAIAASL